jgi:hypothetical protein
MAPSTSTVSHGNFSCRKSDYATHAFEKALASEQITNQDYNLIKELPGGLHTSARRSR